MSTVNSFNYSPGTAAQLAYTVDQAAHMLGRDRKFVDRQIKANRLSVKYGDSRPMILHGELVRFLESLPDEKQAA